MSRRTRVHIENFRPGESEVRLDAGSLEAALARAHLPRELFDISYTEEPDRFEAAATGAEVLSPCGAQAASRRR